MESLKTEIAVGRSTKEEKGAMNTFRKMLREKGVTIHPGERG